MDYAIAPIVVVGLGVYLFYALLRPFHPNFAPPATNVSSPSTFGILTSVQTAENGGNGPGNYRCGWTSQYPTDRFLAGRPQDRV
jgi:K+-transporting ATPase KdpF subunit